jgi:hypothetical protein
LLPRIALAAQAPCLRATRSTLKGSLFAVAAARAEMRLLISTSTCSKIRLRGKLTFCSKTHVGAVAKLFAKRWARLPRLTAGLRSLPSPLIIPCHSTTFRPLLPLLVGCLRLLYRKSPKERCSASRCRSSLSFRQQWAGCFNRLQCHRITILCSASRCRFRELQR